MWGKYVYVMRNSFSHAKKFEFSIALLPNVARKLQFRKVDQGVVKTYPDNRAKEPIISKVFAISFDPFT